MAHYIHSLVSTRSTLARILGRSAETQGLGATEGGRSPDLLLLLTVDSFKHGLLGLECLRLGLSLGRDS